MEKSFKISSNQIEKLINKFKKYAHRTINNPHLLFFVKLNNITLSIFKTKSLLLQGNKKEIDQFIKENFNIAWTPAKASQTKNINGIIGCDEVGVGDYFGPLVTCACYLDNSQIEIFKKLNIKDSKKLNDEYILQIANWIKKHTILFVSICENNIYNKLIEKYGNSKLVLSICHNLTLHKVQSQIKNKKYQTVMDEFVTGAKYYQYLRQAKERITKIDCFLPKAEDKYLAVACASIVARATFLNCMKQMQQKLKIKIPLGASNTNEIVKVGKYINKRYSLNDFAKVHFTPITDKILN